MTDRSSNPSAFTHRAFAKLVMDAVRAAGSSKPFHYDPVGNVLRHGDSTLSLHKAYESYARSSAEGRADVVQACVSACVEPERLPLTYSDSRDSIVPMVRRMSHTLAMAAGKLTNDGPGVPPHVLLTPHLTVSLAISGRSGVFIVGGDIFATWGVGFDAALKRATENVARQTDGTWGRSDEAPGVYSSPWRDGLDGSRLLAPACFARLALRGDPVVLAPSDSILVVSGSDDVPGLLSLARGVRSHVERTNSRSFLRALRLHRGRWSHWMPKSPHPAANDLLYLWALDEKSDYDDQGPWLRRFASDSGGVIHVASYVIDESESEGTVRTHTTWRDNGPHALPETHFVQFRRDGEILGRARMKSVLDEMGPAMKTLPGYPVRRLVMNFPTPAQLARMQLEPVAGDGDFD